jgi:hypothetical protein
MWHDTLLSESPIRWPYDFDAPIKFGSVRNDDGDNTSLEIVPAKGWTVARIRLDLIPSNGATIARIALCDDQGRKLCVAHRLKSKAQ